MNTLAGMILGFLICSLMIRYTIKQSEIDGWIGHDDRVYKFEFLCLKDDADCLAKHNIDIGERNG